MTSKPDPPESIPTYVVEGIERQDEMTLRAIASWAADLAEWQSQEPSQEEILSESDGSEDVTDIQESTAGTVVTKLVPCGKDCSGCPHGPYDYRVTRDGDSLRWEYLGTSTDG